MMFGLREPFRYFQCDACGCLQIAEIPTEISRFYVPGYYAHQPRQAAASALLNGLRAWRDRYAFTGKGAVGKLLFQRFPHYGGEVFRWLQRCGVSSHSRILDVGCGSGMLLIDFGRHGYRHLLGVDPFIASDLEYPRGIRVIKGTLDHLDGSFDLIMFHHSLEHIPDQLATFQAVNRLMAPGGVCLVRIPIASSYAWDHYRENWVQIDAPRHFYLHTSESMRLLGDQTGLDLVDVLHDSTAFQFIGSEMYRQDIPLAVTSKGLFSRAELRRFRRDARTLNAEGRGDSAAFFFRKS